MLTKKTIIDLANKEVMEKQKEIDSLNAEILKKQLEMREMFKEIENVQKEITKTRETMDYCLSNFKKDLDESKLMDLEEIYCEIKFN